MLAPSSCWRSLASLNPSPTGQHALKIVHTGGRCSPARAFAEQRPAHSRQGSLSRAHLVFLVSSCEDGFQPTQKERKETAPLSTPTHCQLQTRGWEGLEKHEQVHATELGGPGAASHPIQSSPALKCLLFLTIVHRVVGVSTDGSWLSPGQRLVGY